MKNIWKSIVGGVVIALAWYAIRFKESKWYIIPFVIDMLLWPVKVIFALLWYMTKFGRRQIDGAYNEILEEVEESMET